MIPIPLGLMRGAGAAPPPPFSATAWNPATTDSELTLSGSNRIIDTNASFAGSTFAVAGQSTGKRYYETTLVVMASAIQPNIGICTASFDYTVPVGTDAFSYAWRSDDAIYDRGAAIASVTCFVNAGDILSVLVDLDANTIKFYANGVLKYSGTLAGVLTGTVYPAIGKSASGGVGNQWSTNFGQAAWAYDAIPTGIGATGWPS